jgi:hypothetical protein
MMTSQSYIRRVYKTPAERREEALRAQRLARLADAAANKMIQGPTEAHIMLGLLASYGSTCTLAAIADPLNLTTEVVKYRLDKIRNRLLRDQHVIQINNHRMEWFIEPTYPNDLDEMFDRCIRMIARDRATLIADDAAGARLVVRRLSATPSRLIGLGA